MVDKYLYNTVFSQAFSPCGNYLVAGNNYGEVAVYSLKNMLMPGSAANGASARKPAFLCHLHNEGSVLSLASVDHFLLSGGTGEIHGWDWKSLISKNKKLSWTINLPTNKDTLEKPDVNVMMVQKETNHLYVGGGDNNIHVCDLENGKLLRIFSGHKDYIHSIDLQDTNCATASEDGSVRIWDTRKDQEVHCIEPAKQHHLARPKLGKWIGAVALSEDWMVCGGGPTLSLWHMRSLTPTTSFPLEDSGIHTVAFHEDRIIAAGSVPHLFHLGYNGDVYAQVPSSSTSVYSVVFQDQPIKVLSAGGSSAKLDICTNFNYRDQTFLFS